MLGVAAGALIGTTTAVRSIAPIANSRGEISAAAGAGMAQARDCLVRSSARRSAPGLQRIALLIEATIASVLGVTTTAVHNIALIGNGRGEISTTVGTGMALARDCLVRSTPPLNYFRGYFGGDPPM